jgi:hypothetical protein
MPEASIIGAELEVRVILACERRMMRVPFVLGVLKARVPVPVIEIDV